MILKNKNALHFFAFSTLEAFDEISHGVFTRTNGFSKGEYKSLNTGLSVGDHPSMVERNRQVIARCMDTQQLVFLKQIHKTGILILKKSDDNRSPKTHPSPFSGDAMVTDIPGKTIAVQLADCQGVLMYDPVKKVAANVHSGWRGSIANILGKCVASMTTEFGCRPEDIIAGISPSLGPCCSEFIHFRQEIPEAYWRYKNRSDHFNFWRISRRQLLNAGLLTQHIELPDICTKCNSHLFFSYRKKNQTGRFVSVIGLK